MSSAVRKHDTLRQPLFAPVDFTPAAADTADTAVPSVLALEGSEPARTYSTVGQRLDRRAQFMNTLGASYQAYVLSSAAVDWQRDPPPQPSQNGSPDRYDEQLKRYWLRTWDDFNANNPRPVASQNQSPDRFDDRLQHWENEKEDIQRHAAPYLLQRNMDIARGSHTGSAILDQVAKQGTNIHVLPDREYGARRDFNLDWSTTGGLTTPDRKDIYMPASSVSGTNPNVVVHEGVHAVLGDALNLDRKQSERIDLTRRKFQEMGLDPADGEALARETQGWPKDQSVAMEHTATAFLGRQMQRELQGLPPESREQRDAVIRRCAKREMALQLLGDQKSYSDHEFLSRWDSIPGGKTDPAIGNNDAERVKDLEKKLAAMKDGDYVDGGPAKQSIGSAPPSNPVPPRRGNTRFFTV